MAGLMRLPLASAAGGLSPAVVSRALDRLVEIVTTALLCLCVVVALTQVFFRYVMNASLPWPEELARWAFVWLVFLGTAMVTRRSDHIAIDLVSAVLPPRVLAAHRLAVRAVMAFVAAVLLVEGFALVGRASYVSPALEWHFRWLYLAIPTGAALTLVFLALEPVEGVRRGLAGLLATAAGVALFLLAKAWAGPLLSGFSAGGVLLTASLALLLFGVPVAFALVFGTFCAFLPQSPVLLLTLPQGMTAALDSFLLLAIPFFIVAAGLMNVGGITERLVAFATTLVGHLRGGLGQVNILTNLMMGGVSGSSMGDAAALSKTLIPAMARRGYPPAFGCALTSSASVLANMIPPGMALIIYGALASVSIGALFVATILPGVLMAGILAVVVTLLSVHRGYGRDIARASGRERLAAAVYAVPALALPVVIVGGIRFGVFTATEAGAIAALYALACGTLIYRRAGGRDVGRAMREALSETVAVVVIIAAAAPFAWLLVSEQVPQKIAAGLAAIADSPILLLLAINLFLLAVGLIMEMIAAMVILVPILLPLVKAVGVDPVHFGIILVANLCVGALTPPLGMLIFTSARVTGTPVPAVFREAAPFVAGLVGAILVITFWPALSMWLVRVIGP